jgi:uncharacterized ion transporter superfamily protein YfcC
MEKLRFPHPLVLHVACIAVGAALTYLLPAGQFERVEDPENGRKVVVAGTYHRVEQAPVDPVEAVVAIPKGLVDASLVVFFVFLVGGAFAVVDKTGVLRHAVEWLLARLGGRDWLVVIVVSLLFAAGGAFENMQEEIIALVPVLLLLTRRMGWDPLTAAAMSVGAAAVGSSFSPYNPFQVLIAQHVAELPQASGALFRLVFLAVALSIWIFATLRYARRARVAPPADGAAVELVEEEEPAPPISNARAVAILAIVAATIAVFVWSVTLLHWDFDRLAAIFFAMGIAVGLVGGLGLEGTAEGYVEGFRSMAFAGILIGFARAISVVLSDGHVIDTIVYGLSLPLQGMPAILSGLGMMILHALVHVPVPSVSGQAVLTMPVLVPLSDLLGITRQATVLAYQYGAGLCELVTPTNGGLLAVLAAAGVRFEHWLKFTVPLALVLFALGFVAVAIAIAIGLA